jgi:micrococcal nuclease
VRRNRRILFWLGVVLAGLGAVRAAGSSGRDELPGSSIPAQENSVPSADVPAEAQQGRVVRIVDGDTIIVAVDRPGGPIPPGDNHRIRMLEIDTPESVKPNYPVECGGAPATTFAKGELPPGSTVYLLADRENKDGFGRYLRYAWDFEGELYNEKAVAEGYARAVLYQPNDLYIDRIRRAENSARQAQRGVWGEACAGAQ